MYAVPNKVHVLDIGSVEDAGPSGEELIDELRQRLASPSYQPPLLPAAALRLLDLTRKADVPFRAIREVLETEPMMTAAVLRLAQSPLYQRQEPIRTLEQAMSRLGTRTLADLFLQVSTTAKVFRAPGFDATMHALRRHSIATAHVARLLCRYVPGFDEYAFMCGLLHDVGAAAGILALVDARKGKPRSATADAMVMRAVFEVHESCAEVLAKAWNLPGDVGLVLGHHHRLVIGGYVHPSAASICVADAVATELGFGAGEEIRQDEVLRARRALGLENGPYEVLKGAAAKLLAQIE
jgi:HD-like signal output (HDOD) protein